MLLQCCMWVMLLATLGHAHNEDDDNYMDISWLGPEVGCTSVTEDGQRKMRCALAAGRLVLILNIGDNDLYLQCEDGAYKCAELDEARVHFLGFTSSTKTLNCLTITGCELEGPFTCVTGIINATDVRSVQLTDTRGRLMPEHVAGLRSVNRFIIEGAEKNITSVPYEALSHLPALTNFTLIKGALKLKETELQLLQLRQLELLMGDLNALPARVFSNTPNITRLLLWGNRIDQIDEDAFAGLSKLQEVSLSKNELEYLPRRLFWPCPQLLSIEMFNNKLDNLLGNMFYLTKVEEIRVMDNRAGLRLDDRTFADLPTLQRLYLETSGIECLPEDMLENTPLQTLSLKGNRLATLPAKVFRSAVLTSLNMNDNLIQNIPVDLFSNQVKLEKLDMSFNVMEGIQSGLFEGLTSLTFLSMRNNRLVHLESASFAGLSSLEHLDLSYNRLTDLQSSTFDVLHSLRYGTRTRSDALDTAPPACVSPFSRLTQLTHLLLQHNQLTEFCEDWSFMLYLQQLNVSDNWISNLSNIDFISNATVDLRHNNITSVQPKVCQSAREDCPTFQLDGNPFICDCQLYGIVKTYRDMNIKNIIELEDAVCLTPAAFVGQLITHIEPGTLTCSYDRCPTHCSCTIYPSPYLLEIDCLYLPPTFPATDFIIELKLKNTPKTISHLPSNIKYLNLSRLNLTHAPYINASLSINLQHNRLGTAPSQLFDNNCSVLLAHNPFVCECTHRENVMTLYKYKHLIMDYSNVSCVDGATIPLAVDTLCAKDSIISYSLAFLASVIAFLTIVSYQFKTELCILLKKYGIWWTERRPCNLVYDAFVSFAHQDERFVYEQLVPELESGRRALKLCIHTRDWDIGDWIPNQITRSIDQSRRTIVVVSEHYVDSMWGLTEFRLAHELQRALVLVLNDVSGEKISAEPALKSYVTMNSYKINDPLVWDRIKDAVLATKTETLKTVNETNTCTYRHDMEVKDCVTNDIPRLPQTVDTRL